MSKGSFDPKLWTTRSPEETLALYTDWAKTYDADVTGAGYQTPARLAGALAGISPDKTAPILDFGCGTGLSGKALSDAGFTTIDGTDITPEMLEKAAASGLYRDLWHSAPGEAPPAGYTTIAAIGVVSLGAAPADTLHTLLGRLDPGGLLAFSYNDATLADESYMTALEATGPHATRRFEEYGPHLTGKDMGSTVYILEKT